VHAHPTQGTETPWQAHACSACLSRMGPISNQPQGHVNDIQQQAICPSHTTKRHAG